MIANLHVIFGSGPAGTWTARALRDLGCLVRMVSRTGRRNDLVPVDVTVEAADAAASSEAVAAARGASVVYQALSPPYHQWAQLFPALQRGVLSAAQATGARYVSIDNLYMYGRVNGPIRADTPEHPHTGKGRLRAAMARDVLDAHNRGLVQATILRSSDYYGPGVLASALGERVFSSLVAGKRADVLGARNVPHAFAYIEDVGLAAATLGTMDGAAGRVWLAPHAAAVTQQAVVEQAARLLGNPARTRVVGPLLARLGGLAVPEAGATVEMLYQFTAPFRVDSTLIEDTYGLTATPIEEGVRRTVGWYRARGQPRGGSP